MRSAAIALVAFALALVASSAFAQCSRPFTNLWGDYQVFDSPRDVAVGNGVVYVLSLHREMQVFCEDGTPVGTIGSAGNGPFQFDQPYGVAVAPSGEIYVCDLSNMKISKFSSTGVGLLEWGTSGTGPGQFQYPTKCCVAPNGNVYVADYLNHRIQYFSSSGAFLGMWGSQGVGDGEFDYPTGVWADASGDVWVCESGNNRVQHFTATGTFLGKFGTQGTGLGELCTPTDIEVGPDGFVYVCEGFDNPAPSCTTNYRVQAFTTSGVAVCTIGGPGLGPGQFSSPWGIGFNRSSGALFVVDTDGRRVERFGSPTATCATPTRKSTWGEVKVLYR